MRSASSEHESIDCTSNLRRYSVDTDGKPSSSTNYKDNLTSRATAPSKLLQMNDVFDRVNQQHSQSNRSRTRRQRQRHLLQPTISTPESRFHHRRTGQAIGRELKRRRPNLCAIAGFEPGDSERTISRGLHVFSLGRDQAAVIEGLEIEARGIGSLDREHGSTGWGEWSVCRIIWCGFWDHACCDAVCARGLEVEGEVEIVVRDGHGVQGWYRVWRQVIEL